MTDVASLTLTGEREMQAKLMRLDANTRARFLTTAVVAGALPIMNRAKDSAQNERVTSPNNTGNLARSIHIGGHQGLEQPTTGSDIGGSIGRDNFAEVLVGTNTEYGRRVELGFIGIDAIGRHYHQPPYPYLRPAFDEKRGEAMKEMAEALRVQLRRVRA